jgi:hypothetical protein
MGKPRLVVRLAVALITFILGIASTLLFSYFWPGARLNQPVSPRVVVTTRLVAVPQAPCAGQFVAQPAFEWAPVQAPVPPAPPVAPQPPARAHTPQHAN